MKTGNKHGVSQMPWTFSAEEELQLPLIALFQVPYWMEGVQCWSRYYLQKLKVTLLKVRSQLF